MEPKKKSVIYWHPAFFANIQIELKDEADKLTFENEHHLSKKPMQIDVLIIKKEKAGQIRKNIGKIFKKHNVIEYKSPGRSLGIDDFYKVYGYACFYKANVVHADAIPAKEVTITFVSERFPRKLIRHLRTVKKYDVEKAEDGIYNVKGDVFSIQILVTRELSEKENLWLKSLTNNPKEPENARQLIEDYQKNQENDLYRSALEAIMHANQKVFQEVNGMTDIFMEIVQEKFNRKLKEETEKAVGKAGEYSGGDLRTGHLKVRLKRIKKDGGILCISRRLYVFAYTAAPLVFLSVFRLIQARQLVSIRTQLIPPA